MDFLLRSINQLPMTQLPSKSAGQSAITISHLMENKSYNPLLSRLERHYKRHLSGYTQEIKSSQL